MNIHTYRPTTRMATRFSIPRTHLGPSLCAVLIHCRAPHQATHCNTLQHTATHCNSLQYTATHCNTLQHTATHCKILHSTAPHCTTLHHPLGASCSNTVLYQSAAARRTRQTLNSSVSRTIMLLSGAGTFPRV